MKFRLVPFDSETRTAFLSSSFLFGILAALILLKSSRDALFLSSYSSRMLPYAMTLNTIVSALAALVYLRIYRYFSLPRVIRVSFGVFIAGTLLFWRATGVHFPHVSGLLYLWVGIFGTIAPVQGWALVESQFSTRQAKRVMGIIGGGAIFGAMAGGVLARLLGRTHSTWLLLPSAASFILLALLVCLMLSPRPKEPEKPATTAVEVPRNYRRFLLLLLLIVALGTFVSAFVDFEFKTVAQRHTHSVEGLTAFFGAFYAYLGAATLLFQLIGTPVLMRRLGIAATLSILPLFLLIGNAMVLFGGLFLATLFMRSSDELFRYSVDRSSLEVLYVGIPKQAKVRLKSAIDTIGVRFSEALASVTLIALFSVGHSAVHFLFLINSVLIPCWLLCAILLGKREYPRLLAEEIQRKEIDVESVKNNLFTMDFYRLLPQFFQNGEKQVVLDLMELLETSGKRWIGRYIAVALNREEKEIRLRALKLLFHQDANLSGSVRGLVGGSEPEIRTEVIHYLCWRANVSPSEFAAREKDADLTVQVAATAAVFRKRDYHPIGYQALEDLRQRAIEKINVEARLEICHVLEFVTPSNPSTDLYRNLLADPSLEVRRSALKSITTSRPMAIIPDLLRSSNIPALASDVRSALGAFGPVLIPLLTKILEDPAERILRKKVALEVAADIGATRAIPVILKAARNRNVMIRFEAIKCLNRLKKKQLLPLPSREKIGRLLREEINALQKEFSYINDFSPRPDGLLWSVLRQRYVWAAERIFRLIGLLREQSSVYYAYLAWNSHDPRLSDAALDYLERDVEPELKKILFPILEKFPEGGQPREGKLRKKATFKWLREKEPLMSAALIGDLTDEELQEWRREIHEELKASEHPLIEEILNRRERKMDEKRMEKDHQQLSTIEKMEHLGKIDLFSKLGSHELLLLADQAVGARFSKGQRIFNEGEIAREAFSLLDGEVVLNRGTKHLATVAPGESFGTLELLSDQPRLFSATADKDSFCLKIDREVLWEILEDYPAVSRAILDVLVQQIRQLTGKIAESVTV